MSLMMEWPCASCTFLNAAKSSRCEVCDAKQPSKAYYELYSATAAADFAAAAASSSSSKSSSSSTSSSSTTSSTSSRTTAAIPGISEVNPIQIFQINRSGSTNNLNGVYDPVVGEKCGGLAVYRKRTDRDVWLEFDGQTDWWIRTTDCRGSSSRRGMAYVSIPSPCLPENIIGSSCVWKVATGTSNGFVPSDDVKISVFKKDILGTSPIQIYGGSGDTKVVNGVYDPTRDCCGGVTVYRKRTDPDCLLEYGADGSADW